MSNKPLQKLELTWIGKGEEPKLEPRILIENPEYSYGDPNTGNMLIHGDNLLALKALEQEYAGKVKCIYIDPPYNTGSAFEYYDDNLEHSTWLNLMHQRLILLRSLLSKDGFICCHIDDSEGQYLKVLMDEVFGRNNYLTTFYVRVRYPDKTLKQDMDFHKEIEQIHIYRKEFGAKPNRNQSQANFEKFNFYFTEKGNFETIELGGKRVEVFRKGAWKIEKGVGTEDGRKEIWATGSILDGNSSGRFFRDYLDGRYEIDGYGALYKIYGIGDDKFDFRYFTGPQKEGATKGKYFQGVPISQLESLDNIKYTPINNFYDLAGSFGNCRTEGGVDFRSGKKPEKLLNIILSHFSNKGDLVLDSFLGSASTIAVAHKMGRKWIGIELGEHAFSHCIPRLKNIINGLDNTGISAEVTWQGGGGFRFYTLAPSLLNQDRFGNWIISREYNPAMLAAAMAKQEGFGYQPDTHTYWKQGRSSEQDYIYVTTQFLTVETLESIHDEMQPGESLLICCKSFQKECKGRFGNITLKKIPQMLLGRCEFGKDDYSLNIVNMPVEETEALEMDTEVEDTPESVQELCDKIKTNDEPTLFG
ncbi:MAG: site-specific DNA-methyltransferase [Bacteroidetes bacterium]|nr:site-specific DNA-methyltransferase [Bacteroidota bacterium]